MTQEMPPLIDTRTMVARVRDYGLSTTNQVVTMMMSAAFATSALAIADIMRTPDQFWVRLTLWLSASVFAILAMTRQLHGNSLIVHPSPFHVPMQLAVGFFIASLFAFIPFSTGGADGWRFACVLQLLIPTTGYASYALLRRHTRPEFFSAELRFAVKRRVEALERQTFLIPISLLLIGAGIVAAWMSKSNPDPWMQILVAINVFFTLGTLSALVADLRSFRTLLDDIEAVRVAALMDGKQDGERGDGRP